MLDFIAGIQIHPSLRKPGWVMRHPDETLDLLTQRLEDAWILDGNFMSKPRPTEAHNKHAVEGVAQPSVMRPEVSNLWCVFSVRFHHSES